MLANPLTENANNNNGSVQSNGDGISTKVEEYVANVHGCLDQAKGSPVGVFFLTLSTDDYTSSQLIVLLDTLRSRANPPSRLVVVGVPDWKEEDLRFCHDRSTMTAVQVRAK